MMASRRGSVGSGTFWNDTTAMERSAATASPPLPGGRNTK